MLRNSARCINRRHGFRLNNRAGGPNSNLARGEHNLEKREPLALRVDHLRCADNRRRPLQNFSQILTSSSS